MVGFFYLLVFIELEEFVEEVFREGFIFWGRRYVNSFFGIWILKKG